ncbi:MAG: hypothetical protein LBU87_03470 [Lactobacillales bacterium]|nr:hypothetical protein [Lactobacillales bacterium]
MQHISLLILNIIQLNTYLFTQVAYLLDFLKILHTMIVMQAKFTTPYNYFLLIPFIFVFSFSLLYAIYKCGVQLGWTTGELKIPMIVLFFVLPTSMMGHFFGSFLQKNDAVVSKTIFYPFMILLPFMSLDALWLLLTIIEGYGDHFDKMDLFVSWVIFFLPLCALYASFKKKTLFYILLVLSLFFAAHLICYWVFNIKITAIFNYI